MKLSEYQRTAFSRRLKDTGFKPVLMHYREGLDVQGPIQGRLRTQRLSATIKSKSFFSLMRLSPFRSFLISGFAALAAYGGLSLGLPAFAGKDYELKVDRFDNSKVAKYRSSLGSEDCKLTKAHYPLNDRLGSCSFLNILTSEGIIDTSVSFYTVSDDWELLSFRSLEKVNTIITYKDNTIVRMKLSVDDIDGTVKRGYVIESVNILLNELRKDLVNIEQIEIQVGHNEYLWKPDPVLTIKALNFEE